MARFTGHMALQELLSGNERFCRGEMRHPDEDRWHREQLARGQAPSAVVVGCSDSRIPPSVIFDAGLGFLFTIRNPGHIVDDITLGSIEYAIDRLGTQLVMVLGHTDCGAVHLAMSDGVADGYLASVQRSVRDVIAWPDDGEVDAVDATTVEEGVRANVAGAVQQVVTAEPVVAPMVKANRVQVVGAVYDLETGKVTLMERSQGR